MLKINIHVHVNKIFGICFLNAWIYQYNHGIYMQLHVEVLHITFYHRAGSTDSIFGPVRNPWNYKFAQSGREQDKTNDWHIAGGSSGGSAVAVATGASFG